jgi:carbon monoxide dehydrogenase subunit G
MQITDTFHVDVPVEQAWDVLLDVERIAPCMPGAQLQEVEGDEYRGIVKVKVGPITAQYKGAARITEANVDTRTIVIKAEGRDTRGQGNASATVTASLTADATGTEVGIDTDLHVTGKVAQFGRGVMADVSSKLLAQFVECLHGKVLSGDGMAGGAEAAGTTSSSEAQSSSAAPSASAPGATPAAASTSPSPAETVGTSEVGAPAASADAAEAKAAPAEAAGGVRKIEGPEAAPVDLGRVAGGAVAKRLVPLAIGVLVVVGVVIWLVAK